MKRVRVRHRSGLVIFLLGFGLAAAQSPTIVSADVRGIIASTDRGLVVGLPNGSGSKFLGVPYAAPPLGELRFRPPRAHPRWQGRRSATALAATCPQVSTAANPPLRSEDCLYLNVYTPTSRPGRDARRYPVMVFFHGGGLEAGASNPYDPTRLVERGTVVVTINYRLGALGFLAHPALSQESSYQGSGNYGLMDQQQALRWVRENAAQFAGDPRNVTIFGQSGGGLSVLAQLASPTANGLFQRAITQSGSYSLRQRSLAEAEAEGVRIAAAVGCSAQDVRCLRGAPVDVLLANQGSSRLQHLPNLDGKVLPQSVHSALARGEFNRVPVMVGSTHDEMTLYIASRIELVRGALQAEGYAQAIANSLELPADAVASVIEAYPLARYISPGGALATLTTDAIFACNARTAAQLLADHVPTYAYEFDDPDAPTYLPSVSFPYGATHGSDLSYFFVRYPGQVNPPAFMPEQAQLSDFMIRYWTQFARSGTPNGPHTPVWPRYGAARGSFQLLTPPRPESYTGFAADHQCAFWDALYE